LLLPIEIKLEPCELIDAPYEDGDTGEQQILMTFVKGCKEVLEIGTFKGRTAINTLFNSKANVTTINLETCPPDIMTHDASYINKDKKYYYEPYVELVKEEKIGGYEYRTYNYKEQTLLRIVGDSRYFDELPYKDKFDLIFIDANHQYEFVSSDIMKAIVMCKTGGKVVCHDYTPNCWLGVFQSVNELIEQGYCFKLIKDTSLVILEIE